MKEKDKPEKEPAPDRMDRVEAQRLRADILEVQLAEQRLRPIRERIAEMQRKYNLDPTVGIDYDTGEIQRRARPTKPE